MKKSWILPGIVTFLLPLNFRGFDIVDIFVIAWVVAQFHIFNQFFRHYTWLASIYLFSIILYFVSIAFSGGANASFVLNTSSGQLVFIGYLGFLLFDKSETYFIRLKYIINVLALSVILFSVISLLQVLLGISLADFQFDIVRGARFMGYSGDPNILALTTISPIFLLTLDFEQIKNSSALRAIAVLLIVLILIFTQSRSAIGGVFIGSLIGALVMYRKKKTWGIVLCASFLVAAVISFTNFNSIVSERFSYTGTSYGLHAEEERASFVYPIACLIKSTQTPILGVGPGNAAKVLGITNIDNQELGCHNTFAQMLLENGHVVGAIFFLLIASLMFWLVYPLFARPLHKKSSTWRIFAIFVAIFLISFYQDLLVYKAFWMQLAIVSSGISSNSVFLRDQVSICTK